MREAHFWDLLETSHYFLIVCFLGMIVLEVHFLRKMWRKRRRFVTTILSIVLVCTLGFGVILRESFFPGGSLADTFYDADRSIVSLLQRSLEDFKSHCKQYPTTEQGLGALVEKPSNAECSNYQPAMRLMPSNLKYVSDGTNYELETAHPYHIRGLVVRATNQTRARLYIREKSPETK